jgi:hypothetical protein
MAYKAVMVPPTTLLNLGGAGLSVTGPTGGAVSESRHYVVETVQAAGG